MAKITLTNDFHNTSITLITNGHTISEWQAKKAYNTLCGIKGCTCCNMFGQRGKQSVSIDQYQTTQKAYNYKTL